MKYKDLLEEFQKLDLLVLQDGMKLSHLYFLVNKFDH